jgi:DNA-directed RNA polymerase I, II, and III subunit RPABC1
MSSEDDQRAKQKEAGERDNARLWRAWRTIHEMVQDRGYILAEEEVKISLEDFKNAHKDGSGMVR